jgi:hypothetical protein
LSVTKPNLRADNWANKTAVNSHEASKLVSGLATKNDFRYMKRKGQRIISFDLSDQEFYGLPYR